MYFPLQTLKPRYGLTLPVFFSRQLNALQSSFNLVRKNREACHFSGSQKSSVVRCGWSLPFAKIA